MRELSSLELDRIKLLTENSVEFCMIEPTQTGLSKSIMDATGPVKVYLKSNQIHDYLSQRQGQDYKTLIPSFFLTESSCSKTIASLYRPSTKKGDPRIWFKGMGDYAYANDILALIAFESKLYVLNITRIDLIAHFHSEYNNPIKEFFTEFNKISGEVADELLMKLKDIASRGFIPALLQADTSIGRTLEHLLGIPMNSSRTPDYKGIEIKAGRENRGTRKQLFAKTPDWELSKFKNRNQILDTFGYWQNGIFRLYTTTRATGRNAQGLILRTDYEMDYLFENSDRREIGDFLVWKLEVLRNTLAEKHKETFWVKAESKIEFSKELFKFKSVEHTRSPIVSQIGMLIDIGAITLDYPMKKNSDGSVIDKGCNFKLKPSALDLLFPPSKKYSLLEI
jgi:hypothetical protein